MSEANSSPINAVVGDAAATEQLVVKLLAAFKAQGISGLVASAPEAVKQVEQDYEDVVAVIPVVKDGWKTSEFWSLAVTPAIAAIFKLVTGHDAPAEVLGIAGGLSAVYIGARTLLKLKTPVAAPVAPVAASK